MSIWTGQQEPCADVCDACETAECSAECAADQALERRWHDEQADHAQTRALLATERERSAQLAAALEALTAIAARWLPEHCGELRAARKTLAKCAAGDDPCAAWSKSG